MTADAAAALGRQPARPHPAAVDGRAWSRTGCSRTSTPTSPRTAGTSARRRSWRRTASPTDGTRGAGSLYAAGLNYSLTGVFYNKELAAADRHDRAAQDRWPSSRTCWPRPRTPDLQPIMAVERHRQRRRARLPAPEPDGRLRADRPDQRLDLPEARRDDRHAQQPRPPRSISSSGSRPATSRRTPTPSSTPTPTPGSARARACSCSTVTGRTPSTTRTSRATSGSSSSRPPRAGGKQAAMSAPLTYGIAANAKHADCAAFFLNWVATNDKARADRRRRRRLEPGRPARPPGPAGGRGLRDQRDAGGRRRRRQGQRRRWTSSPTRPGPSSRQGWTPELQKMVGGKQDAAGLLKAVQAEYQKELNR